LELASIQLNAHQVDSIIESIAAENAALPREITKFARQFQYEQILSRMK
jgi:hypothetical protein